jgi:hypothetical protein
VIEIFYGLAFLASIPKPSDHAVVEFAGLMIANAVIVNYMIYMINNTLLICTIAWWLICLVLMFARLTGDILKQIYAKIYPTADLLPTSGISTSIAASSFFIFVERFPETDYFSFLSYGSSWTNKCWCSSRFSIPFTWSILSFFTLIIV